MKSFGPYAPFTTHGGLVFTAGQVGVNAQTGEAPQTIAEQTTQALKNLAAVLEEAGSSLQNVKKTTVFLTDMDNFAAMNEAYAAVFNTDGPARSTVAVKELPRVARTKLLIEIEAIATRKQE